MYCPHCNSFMIRDLGKDSSVFSITDHPYPYTKYDTSKQTKSKTSYIQKINKLICVRCGETFFEEIRLGTDMGGDSKFYYQVYKQGQYKYKDFSRPLVTY